MKMIANLLLYSSLALGAGAENDRTLPNDLESGEMVYTIPTLEARFDFEETQDHPAGTYLFYEKTLPQEDHGKYYHTLAVSEFRFEREQDDLTDVVMIQTSPDVSRRPIFRVDGNEQVTLAYGCDENRKCESEYSLEIVYICGDYFICDPDFIGNTEFNLNRLLRIGQQNHRQMLRTFRQNYTNIPFSSIIGDQVSFNGYIISAPFDEKDLRKVTKNKIRLEEKIHPQDENNDSEKYMVASFTGVQLESALSTRVFTSGLH